MCLMLLPHLLPMKRAYLAIKMKSGHGGDFASVQAPNDILSIYLSYGMTLCSFTWEIFQA